MTDKISFGVSGDVSVDEKRFLVHGVTPKSICRFDNIIMLCVRKQKGIL